MGRPVGANEPRPVDREAHGQALDRDVMDDLVVAALQEGRVDRAEGLHAARRHAGGEGHRVLLRDPDIETALREPVREEVQARPVRHRRGHGNHAAVALGFPDQALGEDLGVGRRVRRRLLLRARDDVELRDAVILVRRPLRRRVALALDGAAVDQHRLVGAHLLVAQHLKQPVEIVAVDRSDIVEAELLEERAADRDALDELARAPRALDHRPGQHLHAALGRVHQVLEGRPRHDAREVARHRARRRRDRHLVVVEDDEEPLVQVAGVVHRLVGHARRQRAVADDGDDVAHVVAAELAGHREAKARRDRGRGMRRSERVILAFRALGEPAQAPAGAQRPDAVAPAGEDLVRIALVPDVPDQLVARRVEDRVDRHRELDDAEARPEMPAGDRDGGDRLLPQLVGHRLQLGVAEALEVGGHRDPVQMGCGAGSRSWSHRLPRRFRSSGALDREARQLAQALRCGAVGSQSVTCG
jgi:hypothetical protein